MSLGPSQLSVYNDCNLQKTQIASYYLQSLPLVLVSKGCRYMGFQIHIGEQAKNCPSGNPMHKYSGHSAARLVTHTLKKISQSAATDKHPCKPFRWTWPGQSLPPVAIYHRGVGINVVASAMYD